MANTKKRCPLHHRDWNAKVGSQEMPGVTGNFGLEMQNEAGQRLTEFCQESKLVVANTLFQQHKRRPNTWTSPDGQYQNQTDYFLCSQNGEVIAYSKWCWICDLRRRFSFGTKDQAWSLKNLCVSEFYWSMKRDRENFWHRHQKGDRECPPQ